MNNDKSTTKSDLVKLNLYQKLLKIQQHVIGLEKDKSAFNYKYVTGDKVLGEIKPLMNEHGLILKQEVLSIDNVRQDYDVKNGKKSEINSKVMMRFTWVDCESGEKDENLFGANGQNDWDKGVGSALTYAERYFLLKYFHIATDEDDIDNPERKPQDTHQNKPQPAKKEVDVKPISPVKPKEKPIEQTLTEEQQDYLADKLIAVSEATNKTVLMEWAKDQKDWIKINTAFREAVRKKALTFVEPLPAPRSPLPAPLPPSLPADKGEAGRELGSEVAAKHTKKESYFDLPWLSDALFKESLAQIDAGNVALFPELETKYRIKMAHKSALQQAHEFSIKVS